MDLLITAHRYLTCLFTSCSFLGVRMQLLIFLTSLQATLTAEVNGRTVSTMVSTADLNITTGKVSTIK